MINQPARTISQSHDDHQATILVVDDETGPRESLKMILAPEHKVVTANNGKEALTTFDASVPDMVITDIRMPIMTGVDLMKAVKERSPETPVVIITGYGTLQTAQEAVRTGVFDYISKPYDVEVIRNVVKDALRELREKQQQRQSLDQLRQMNAQLETQIRKLDRKASIGDLSAEMVHDLNNPITVLRGYITLLEGGMSNAQNDENDLNEQEFIDVIKEQTERCMRLTRNFLDYARDSESKWDYESLNSVVHDSLFVLRLRMQKLWVGLETSLDPAIPPAWIQATPLQQVIYNLVANAIDAMEECDDKKHLALTTRLLEDADAMPTAKISIKDSGPGIPQDAQDKLFTPFFTTKPKGKGTGLGLAICKRIVDEHNGTIDVESGTGQGTCFTITIPLPNEKPVSQNGKTGSSS